MRIALLAVLLSACATEGAVPLCAESPADRMIIEPFAGGLQTPPDATRVVGRFESWAPGDMLFTSVEGGRYSWGVNFDGVVQLPDLPAQQLGLSVFGFNPRLGDQSTPVFHLYDPIKDGDTALIAGNVEALEPIGGLVVRSPRDVDTCPDEWLDDGVAHQKPVFVSRGGEEATLYAGDTAEVGGLTVTIVTAESWFRVHPFLPCPQGGCPRERLEWFAAP